MAIYSYTATNSSGEALAANAGRNQLVITNTGSNDVFLNFGGAAELNKGIFLVKGGGVFSTDDYIKTNDAIYAITVSGTTNLAILEI